MLHMPSSPVRKPQPNNLRRMCSTTNHLPLNNKTIQQIVIKKPGNKVIKSQSFSKGSSIIQQYVKETLQKLLHIKRIQAAHDGQNIKNNSIYAQRYILATRQFSRQINPQQYPKTSFKESQNLSNVNQQIMLLNQMSKKVQKQPFVNNRRIKSTEVNKRISQRHEQYRRSQLSKFKSLSNQNTTKLINPSSQGFKYYIKQSHQIDPSIQLKFSNIFANENFLLEPCQVKTLKLQKRPFTALDQYPQESDGRKSSRNQEKDDHQQYRLKKSSGLISHSFHRRDGSESASNYLSEMRVIRLKNQTLKKETMNPKIKQEKISPWGLDTEKDHS